MTRACPAGVVTAVSQLPGAARAGSGVARQPVPVCVVTVSMPVRPAEKIRSPLAVAASAMAPGLAVGSGQRAGQPATGLLSRLGQVSPGTGEEHRRVAAGRGGRHDRAAAAGWPGSGCVTQPEPAR